MENLKAVIVERLKLIRHTKQLNLDQAAELTGISKAMLSQMERGQSMPTITTLWKIATGYKVPLTYFLEEEKSSFTLVDYQNSIPILEENGLMKTFTLFSYNPVQNFEMLYIEFEPKCVHESAKHMDGVEEYIFVQAGSLKLHLGQQEITLFEKQCFRFQADVPHRYINEDDKNSCSILNIIFYPTTMPKNERGN